MSVATLNLIGSGTLTLNNSNASVLTVANTLAVASGQTLQGSGALGGPVSLTGGTLGGAVTYSGAVTAASGTDTISGGALGSALAVSSGSDVNLNASVSPTSTTVSGTLQGSGTLGNAVSLTGGALAGDTYSGAVTATSGTDTISGGTFNSTLGVNGGAILNVNATIAPASASVSGILQGSGTINAPVTLNSGGTLGGTSGTLNVGGLVTVSTGTATIDNVALSGSNYVNQTGGTLTASGHGFRNHRLADRRDGQWNGHAQRAALSDRRHADGPV